MMQYLDKRLFVQLNGSRKVIGVLRGFDVRPLLRAQVHFHVRMVFSSLLPNTRNSCAYLRVK